MKNKSNKSNKNKKNKKGKKRKKINCFLKNLYTNIYF